MDHFNTSSGSASAPAAPAAPANPYFTSGNPSLGVPATVPGPYWFHMISEEMRNVILQAGLIPSHEDLTQLFQAIEAIIDESLAPDASETVKGIVEKATAAEAQAFTADKYIDGARLGSAFQGANQSLAASGYQRLPGGLIIQWGTNNGSAGGDTTVTYPVAFPTAALEVVICTSGVTAFGAWAAINSLVSNTQFTFNTWASSGGRATTGARWIAIGY